MKLKHAEICREERWPADAIVRVGTASRWRVRAGHESDAGRTIRSGTTGFISAADTEENIVHLFVNPAIVWVGTAQELCEMWEAVPDETPLTF